MSALRCGLAFVCGESETNHSNATNAFPVRLSGARLYPGAKKNYLLRCILKSSNRDG